MRHLATYMLEVAVCGGILQAVYSLLLERRIRFRWCRIYLLATTLLAAIIPLLRIPVWPGEVITVAATTPVEGFVPTAVPTAAAPQTMPAEWLVHAVWALGTLFLLGLMAVQVLRIRRLKRGAEVVRTPRYTLVHTPQRIASFSFLNTIYVWQQTSAQEMEAILRHEASHIAHRHTIEHIAMESLKALLWWNPFAWIAARRLIEAEEFEADSDVLEGGYDRELYMNAIFRQLFGYSPEIANGLRDSLTKKRFKMMTSQKPGRYALLRLAGALPAIAGLLCAFSFTSRAAQIRTDTPSTDRAVYLINGTEIAPERIRKIDPEQLTLEKALQGEQIPAEYRQRNAEFVFLFTAEEPLRDYTPIRIEGELHYTDGTPAKGIAVYAGAPFTQPLSQEEMEQSGGRTDSEGRFSIEGPQQGILAYSGSDRMAGLHTYSSNGADPYTISIGIDTPKAEGRNSLAGTPNMVRTSLRVFYTKDSKHFSTENTAPGAIVRIVGTDRGTTTGDDGKASIEAPEGSVLEVSYPGYGSLSLVVSAGETERVVILYPEGTDAADGPIYSRDEYGVRQAPLYMIDGTEASEAPTLVTNDIAEIKLLKKEEAVEKYGERGKYGVVEITTEAGKRSAKQAGTPSGKEDDTPFLIAEHMPLFQGGDLIKFREWIQTQLRYPEEARKQGIQGRVVLTFVVERDGSVTETSVLQSPHQLLTTEALRIVRSSSGLWSPAEQKGEKVRLKYTLPVDFRMAGKEPDASVEPEIERTPSTVEPIVAVSFGEQEQSTRK